MKRSFKLALVAAAAIAVTAIAIAIVDPAAGWMLADGHVSVLHLASGLVALRAELGTLETRAAQLLADAKKEGLTADQIRKLEEDHAKALGDVANKKREIETAEAAEREAQNRSQPVAWTPEQVTTINGRALAFGLTAADAVAAMGDAKLRTLDDVTNHLQDKAAQTRGNTPRQQPHVTITADEGDKLREAVGDAVLLRANPQAIVGTDQATRDRIAAARQFRGMSLLEAGRDFMQRGRGIDMRGLSRMEVATVLLGMRQAGDFGLQVRAGMHSTSDFANVLANVSSKRLRDAYAAAPQTWKPFCRQSNNPDFKTKSVVQLSSAPVFKRVREGEDYSYGGMTDGAESYALATYGRVVVISRQAIINDDLNAFDRLPSMIGRQAASLENSTVYGILTANAAMADTVALFHADHNNLRTGTVIDETNLALAEKYMMEQVSLGAKTEDQEKLNIRPSFLVTGSAYKVAAQKILTAIMPAASSDVNVFQGTLTPIADANVTGNKWFVIANPSDIDTIEYSYLEGEEGVFIEQMLDFENDGLKVKGRLDFAAKAIDWRGMQYNPGA